MFNGWSFRGLDLIYRFGHLGLCLDGLACLVRTGVRALSAVASMND